MNDFLKNLTVEEFTNSFDRLLISIYFSFITTDENQILNILN